MGGEDRSAQAQAETEANGGSAAITNAKAEFNVNPDPQAGKPDFLSLVPEDLKQEQFVQELTKTQNPVAELVKMHKNVQPLIGRKDATPPGENATPEEIANWRKQVGVPDDINDYSLENIQYSEEDKPFADYLASTRDDDFMKSMKETAKELGLTPKQFAGLAKKYDENFIRKNKDFLAQQALGEAELDRDFDAQAQKFFGSRKDAVLDNGKKIMNATLPPDMRSMVAELDNKSLMILAAALDGSRKLWGKEDGMVTAGTGFAATSRDDLRGAIHKEMANPAYSDPSNPNHQAQVQKVNAMYVELGKLPKS